MTKEKIYMYKFLVSISIDSKGVPDFTYYEPGNPTPLSKEQRAVEVDAPTVIFYELTNLELSPKGLKFVGAGFKNPYDGIIENAFVSEDGKTLILEDLCKDYGTTNFHLLAKCDRNNLIIISPDPEVVNKNIG
ncbi:DP-EP family protein [Shewanella fodinae]|uniref:Uncharacterized protein DUF1888 n=1 Tax=Shewanella fodinae TaxID=552357 RepID=A0A4R2FEL2_9GAMM|nr:DP-EP family protein [Shewanella fodinae]TCN86252.1 uncharacterized protein DUF1888 [Shewanella fodinae]